MQLTVRDAAGHHPFRVAIVVVVAVTVLWRCGVHAPLGINPRNALQAPEVLVLVGDSDVCAEAVCLARHLLNHHVKPLLYLTAQTLPTLSAEGFAQYKLYLNSGGTLIETASKYAADTWSKRSTSLNVLEQ